MRAVGVCSNLLSQSQAAKPELQSLRIFILLSCNCRETFKIDELLGYWRIANKGRRPYPIYCGVGAVCEQNVGNY